MRPTVYLETSIIGYLAMRMSGVLRTAANQQMTRDWRDNYRAKYDVLVSRFVVEECSHGDPTAARERHAYPFPASRCSNCRARSRRWQTP